MPQDENPKSHGTLQMPVVFGYLSSGDFARLTKTLEKRKIVEDDNDLIRLKHAFQQTAGVLP